MSKSIADGASSPQLSNGEPPGRQHSTGRRPSSARTSSVQQKLQSALARAEKTSAELASNASLRQLETLHSQSDAKVDRSVARYRSAAAVVSFTEPATAFSYASSLMPGVHFYTFLAARDAGDPPKAARTTVNSTAGANLSGPAGSGVVPAGEGNESRTRQRLPTSRQQRRALKLNVPDTILYGESGRAVWIYTDSDGYVQHVTEFSDKQVLDKFAATAPALPDDQHLVVYKEPIVTMASANGHGNPDHTVGSAAAAATFNSQGNQLRLLNLGEVKSLLNGVMAMRKAFALQQFVRCNGAKAFVQRAVYEAGKPAHAWMISNTEPFRDPNEKPGSRAATASSPVATVGPPLSPRPGLTRSASSSAGVPSSIEASSNVIPLVNRLCTSVHVDQSCTFVKLTERGCATVSELNLRIVKHIEQRLRLPLQTFVADFVKDAAGEWWLLQVKAFQIQNRFHPERAFALPLKLRVAYLNYRDAHILDEDEDAIDEDRRSSAHLRPRHRRGIVPLAQRHIHKLVQCKCCLAAYPNSELSFKMTLKMINDMLVRIRSRLPPEKTLAFLTAALARELPESVVAYESWSVCSFCYAIYERDQQLQRIEAKFSVALGLPNRKTLEEGLSRIQDRSFVLDPGVSTAAMPSQLTLCRLVLVINAIYDIPPELYNAEKENARVEAAAAGDGKQRHQPRSSASRLYLRISALGYTECIPINADDILPAHEKAPGARRRRDSVASTVTDEGDEETREDGGEAKLTSERRPKSSRQLSRSRLQSTDDLNYWLPTNLIRTIPFFAPRTPLQAKLKETSGIAPFLAEDSSVRVQLIRATEPPLQDPTVLAARRRPRTRRVALVPETASLSELVSQMHAPSHSVVLGSTKIRMAQFRSAYVTKIDYYACMAVTGEMLNIKGNIGLERVRYVDSRLLMAQHRLRTYNGVFIPDESYTTGDALTSEWMDCFRASSYLPKRASVVSGSEKAGNAVSTHMRRISTTRTPPSSRPSRATRPMASRAPLLVEDEEMDQQLEQMIEQANSKQQQAHLQPSADSNTSRSGDNRGEDDRTAASTALQAKVKQTLLPDGADVPSRSDSAMAMLLTKPVISPRSELADGRDYEDTDSTPALALTSPRNRRWLWSLVIQLNQAHHLQSREHSCSRWECHYTLFMQKRSAIERITPSSSPAAVAASGSTAKGEVQFTCTHTFVLAGTTAMMRTYLLHNPSVTLHFRNDMYASTRSDSEGEFFGVLELTELLQTRSFASTLDLLPAHRDPTITPREAADIARRAPYLSLSVQLSRLPLDPDEALRGETFLHVGVTSDGLEVLRKLREQGRSRQHKQVSSDNA